MRRKILYGGICLVLVLAILGFIFRNTIKWTVIALLIKPGGNFEEIERPLAPDYSRPEHWAALPDRQDNADVVPAGGAADNQATAAVDVFFIHPTTYYSGAHWNQPLGDPKANEFTDKNVLRGQASVFNGIGRVYAPRYRQATLYSFIDEKGNGQQALELAYADVKAAFQYYLDNYNQGRPIILASHSQGSRHGIKLLEDFFEKEPLRSKLVAAYMVGWARSPDRDEAEIAGIPVCESRDQTGCWLTWNSVGPAAAGGRIDYIEEDAVCVNPLTWKADGEYAPHELNLGGVSFSQDETDKPELDVGVVCAQCVDGLLVISRPEVDGYSYMPMGKDNYHIYDYGLFYMNVRENARERVEAYIVRSSTNEAE
jgi:hypothetical protein